MSHAASIAAAAATAGTDAKATITRRWNPD